MIPDRASETLDILTAANEIARTEAGRLVYRQMADALKTEAAALERLAQVAEEAARANRALAILLYTTPADLPDDDERAVLLTSFIDCATLWAARLLNAQVEIRAAAGQVAQASEAVAKELDS